jgi:hypothetical protein
MRRSRADRIWADGIMWDRSEWERAQKLAIAISGPDVKLIDQLVRHCEDARRRGRPDMVSGSSWDEEKRYQQLVRDLYERADAATAARDDPQTVPLTVAEIKQIEQLRYQIQYFTGYYMHDRRDPMLDQADDLLNKLHFLAGHAKATSTLGGVTVFRVDHQVPAVADLLDPLDRSVRQGPLGGDLRRIGSVAALPGAEAKLLRHGGRGAKTEVVPGVGVDAAGDQEQRGRAVGQAAGLDVDDEPQDRLDRGDAAQFSGRRADV